MSAQDRIAHHPAPPSEFPGWYPDPFGEGLDRFWNGRTWTDKVKDEPTPPVDPDEPVSIGESRLERRLSEALSTSPAAGVPEPEQVTSESLRESARPGSVFAVSSDELAAESAPPRRPPSLFSAARSEHEQQTQRKAIVAATRRVSVDDDAEAILDLDQIDRRSRDAEAAVADASQHAVSEHAVSEHAVSRGSSASMSTDIGSIPPGVPAPPAPRAGAGVFDLPRRSAGSSNGGDAGLLGRSEPVQAPPLVAPAVPPSFDSPAAGPAPVDTPQPSGPPTVTLLTSSASKAELGDTVIGGGATKPSSRRKAPLWLGLAAASIGVFAGGVVVGRLADDAAPDAASVLAPATENPAAGTTTEADIAAFQEELASLQAAVAAAESEAAAAESEVAELQAERDAALEAQTDEAGGSDELAAELANVEVHNDILLTWFTAETLARSSASWDAEVARACSALGSAGAAEATVADVQYTNWLELTGTESDLVDAVNDCLAG